MRGAEEGETYFASPKSFALDGVEPALAMRFLRALPRARVLFFSFVMCALVVEATGGS